MSRTKSVIGTRREGGEEERRRGHSIGEEKQWWHRKQGSIQEMKEAGRVRREEEKE